MFFFKWCFKFSHVKIFGIGSVCMNIRVIGTGDMWTKFNSASYLIDNEILIDIPNGTCKNLLRIGLSPKDIKHVLITHFHGDHYFDIPFLFLEKSMASSDINVYCDRLGKSKIKKVFKLAFPNTVKKVLKNININYKLDEKFNIDDYKINKVLVEHGKMKPSYGYIIEKDNIKVGFTGDTLLNSNVEYMAEVCNYLFCDCTLINGSNKHMGIDNIKYLAKEYSNCKFVVSHMSDDARSELLNINIKNIIVPNDGDNFNVEKGE